MDPVHQHPPITGHPSFHHFRIAMDLAVDTLPRPTSGSSLGSAGGLYVMVAGNTMALAQG
jgi:hypothetical protein